MINAIRSIAIIVSLFLTVDATAQQWRPVGGSRNATISGIALVEQGKDQATFLVVHDNKKKDQLRISLITINGTSALKLDPLKWSGDEIPVDLEAATAVPNAPNEFLVLASEGRVFHIALDRTANSVNLLRSLDLPSKPKDADFEGFAVQLIENKLVAVWADRGATERPATLFWGKIDISKGTFSSIASAEFRVPFPLSDVRHVSDIKVDTTGAVFVTAASDPGDEGPFSSALYYAGVVKTADAGAISFLPSKELTRLYSFRYNKVEAFDLLPGPAGGIVFGSDDEDLGASIFTTFP